MSVRVAQQARRAGNYGRANLAPSVSVDPDAAALDRKRESGRRTDERRASELRGRPRLPALAPGLGDKSGEAGRDVFGGVGLLVAFNGRGQVAAGVLEDLDGAVLAV